MLAQVKIIARLLSALAEVVRDPEATDRVVDVGRDIAKEPEVFGTPSHQGDPRMAGRVMQAQPIDLEALGALPEGTLGRSYADYMRAHGFTVDALDRGDRDFELAQTLAHVASTHDIWHVLTNFNPQVAGEMGLQAFGAAQFDRKFAPLIMTALVLNALLFAPRDLGPRLRAARVGREMGERAELLLGIDWTPYWARPLAEVRAELGLRPVSADSGFALAA